MKYLIAFAVLGVLPAFSLFAGEVRDEMVIFDFAPGVNVSDWEVENDTVMGGVSLASFVLNETGHGEFTGKVSLENDGGFASVQHFIEPIDIRGYETAVLRVRGDGKRYQFRVESGRDERHAYALYFQTDGTWQTIEIPLKRMYPTWRGNRLDIPNYDAASLGQVRFLIGNGIAESFRLEIDSISLR